VPQRVRVQVVQILREGIGSYYRNGNLTASSGIYDYLHKFMCKELGVHKLTSADHHDREKEFFRWLEGEQDIESWLDGVEQALLLINNYVRRISHEIYPKLRNGDEVITDLNARLREAAIGYEFTNGRMFRKDSEIIHKEVIIPALRLLKEPQFAAADDEYRRAHLAYREGRLEDCIVDCGKSLESVLKVIGGKRGWSIKENDPASKLLKAALDAGFLPAFSQAAMNHLHGLIESSTPTVRNKMGGHGAGSKPRTIPTHLASFQLHQTAAAILFLAEHDAHLKAAAP
jgi:hypothetical protein